MRILKEPEELTKFFIKKRAFTEKFIGLINNSETLTKFRGKEQKYHFDLEDIEKLDYEIDYDTQKKKIVVDITKNNIFSYYDSEEELIKKMDRYIRTEEYEKAEVLSRYLEQIDVKYGL